MELEAGAARPLLSPRPGLKGSLKSIRNPCLGTRKEESHLGTGLTDVLIPASQGLETRAATKDSSDPAPSPAPPWAAPQGGRPHRAYLGPPGSVLLYCWVVPAVGVRASGAPTQVAVGMPRRLCAHSSGHAMLFVPYSLLAPEPSLYFPQPLCHTPPLPPRWSPPLPAQHADLLPLCWVTLTVFFVWQVLRKMKLSFWDLCWPLASWGLVSPASEWAGLHGVLNSVSTHAPQPCPWLSWYQWPGPAPTPPF